MHSIHIL